MNEQEIQKSATQLAFYDGKYNNSILKFNQLLNEEPSEKEIKINEMAGNSKYYPISFVEMELDEIFGGLWKTHSFQYQIVANEILGSIILEVFHPILNVWLTRTGTAAVLIRTIKDKPFWLIENKIKNTFVMDLPHLEAMCIISSAKKLGKRFGRDLNRKLEDNYDPFGDDDKQETIRAEKVADWLIRIKEVNDKELCEQLYEKFKELRRSGDINKPEHIMLHNKLIGHAETKGIAKYNNTTFTFKYKGE